ncbi:hypothetical protein Enr13x_54720 [Stieleria neptunia]|uniref:Uncharacterized protein n=1 Tax=Stieleria neptunia TaxID=2527979 RepID=A0A518HXK9_9BACT|nr:hypothetical protein Enr13x_54720 [Stieleria neptunia]
MDLANIEHETAISDGIKLSRGASKGTTDGRFWSLLKLVVEMSAIDRRVYGFFSASEPVGALAPFELSGPFPRR